MKDQLKNFSWLKPKEPTDYAKQCMEQIRKMLNAPEQEPKREPGEDSEEQEAA